MYPALSLKPGDVVEARWVDTIGRSWRTSATVQDTTPPATAPAPAAPPTPPPPTPPPSGPAPTTPPAPTAAPTIGGTAPASKVTWSQISAGGGREPQIVIDGSIYPKSAATNQSQTGVRFFYNGEPDARHANRPNGWDATGPREGSQFHMYPALTLRSGDVIEARWVDLSNRSWTSRVVVAGSNPAPTPVPPPPNPTSPPAPNPTPPPSNITGLGPTGQWPSHLGFPAYASPATVVTERHAFGTPLSDFPTRQQRWSHPARWASPQR